MNNQRSDTEKTNLIEKCWKKALMKLLNTIKLLLTVQNYEYKMKS